MLNQKSNGSIVATPSFQELRFAHGILSPSQALQELRALIEAQALGTVAHGGYQRGALLHVRQACLSGIEIRLLGDVHARLDNLRFVLEHDGALEKIAKGQCIAIFIGDLIHPERFGQNVEMESSVETFHILARLKARYPKSVYFLLGNHDPLSMAVMKRGGGVLRVLNEIFEEHITQRFGASYAEQYRHYISTVALAAVGKGLCAVHAGPIPDVDSLDDIASIPVEDRPRGNLDKRMVQALWGRYRTGDHSYEDSHVLDFLSACGEPDGVLLCGHNPRSRFGWHWPLTPQHHIIHLASHRTGYARLTNTELSFIEVEKPRQDQILTLPDLEFLFETQAKVSVPRNKPIIISLPRGKSFKIMLTSLPGDSGIFAVKREGILSDKIEITTSELNRPSSVMRLEKGREPKIIWQDVPRLGSAARPHAANPHLNLTFADDGMLEIQNLSENLPAFLISENLSGSPLAFEQGRMHLDSDPGYE